MRRVFCFCVRGNFQSGKLCVAACLVIMYYSEFRKFEKIE